MKDESANLGGPAAGATSAPSLPAAVDRTTFQAELDRLPVREKAHTREGNAIAAARRRLPITEVDASLALTGPHGPLTLLEAFEGPGFPVFTPLAREDGVFMTIGAAGGTWRAKKSFNPYGRRA